MPDNLPPTHDKKDCTDKDCEGCLKKGMPVKREWLSFIVLILLGVSTVLFVLYVNALRKNSSADTSAGTPLQMAESSKTYKMAPVKVMKEMVELPDPSVSGGTSLTDSINSRRSRREFADSSVSLADLSQLLWSAQGVTDENGHRAAPSAKGAYPYTIYIVARDVDGLDAGFYQYMPEDNKLGDLGMANAGDLLNSAGVQAGAQNSPAVLLLVAQPAKMLEKFPDNDPMENVYLEAGHIGQNLYLQAEALNMSTVVMGGFDSAKVGEVMGLDNNEVTVYVVPVGNRVNE